MAAGNYVAVSVTDTGTGIDETIRDKIYEPFFSTKGVGKGTGLGLSMVHGFIKQSGGNIEFETAKNEGTTFRLYLPCSGDSAPTQPVDRAYKRLAGGREDGVHRGIGHSPMIGMVDVAVSCPQRGGIGGDHHFGLEAADLAHQAFAQS